MAVGVGVGVGVGLGDGVGLGLGMGDGVGVGAGVGDGVGVAPTPPANTMSSMEIDFAVSSQNRKPIRENDPALLKPENAERGIRIVCQPLCP